MDAALGGFRLTRAIFSASSASSAVMLGPIDQLAMRRDHMPVASAGYSQPWRVLTWAMSANRAASGSPASNLRPTRSSADSRLDARFSPEGRLAHAHVTPRQPRSRMMRATCLREVRTPSARRRTNVLGAP